MATTVNITFTVLYVTTLTVSLVGNILLIYIVWKKPDARSLTSFMFVNMAVADLLVTLVVIPYTVSDLYTGGVWPMSGLIGEITCKTVLYVAFFTISTSILCLMFMAVDRFYAVVYPLQRLLWFRRPKVLTPIVWLLPMALMSIVPVFIVLYPDSSNYYCAADYEALGGDNSSGIRGVYIYFFVINYLFPVSIIFILYTITAHKLWFHTVPGDYLTQNSHQQQLIKKKVVRMLIIVFTTFALCWLPGQVFQLYYAITIQDKPIVSLACYWFGYNNSAINPWLYIGLNSKMHSAFSRMTGRKARLEKNGLKRESIEVTPTAINETQESRL